MAISRAEYPARAGRARRMGTAQRTGQAHRAVAAVAGDKAEERCGSGL